MKTEFKLHDVVEAFGLEGVVTEIYPESLMARFNGWYHYYFKLDGKVETWHKEPSLKLVRRAEEFEEFVGYQPIKCDESLSWESDYIYESKEDALNQANTIGYREVKYMRRKV